MRVLLTGWASFLHGEATAGDVLSLRAAEDALAAAGMDHRVACSPGFRPGTLHLPDAPPEDCTHVVFVCGPVHGPQVRSLHERYAACRRIAVGVSVPGLAGLDCARVQLDTRLADEGWQRCATPDRFVTALSKMDAVVTTRLHGLVLGLKAGVPVLAVDPVAGGGKVSAQAAALDWPVAAAEDTRDKALLDARLEWVFGDGRARAAAGPPEPAASPAGLVGALVGSR
jgi:hypothetical protein